MKTYDYSKSFQKTKTMGKIIFAFSTILMIVAMLVAKPSETDTNGSFIFKLLMLPVMPFCTFLIYFSFSDIKLNDDGVFIEYVGKPLFVPWTDIDEVKHYGSRKFGGWLVTTSSHRLTIFHRFYSFFSCWSLKPGFVIHSEISDSGELISILQHKGQTII